MLKFAATALIPTLLMSLPAKAQSVPRPTEYAASFDVSDFETKPWMREFEFVIVVNRAEKGGDKQSIKIFRDQKLVTYHDVHSTLDEVTYNEYLRNELTPESRKRGEALQELKRKQWQDGVFKVTTGRNAFERKGEHHSQNDSWTVTPTGYYVPQSFVKKHKSESYSKSGCDSGLSSFLGSVLGKQMCTWMENVIFFNGGIALHKAIPGTESNLGNKGSGGCVRLPDALSQYLYINVKAAKDRLVPKVRPDGSVEMLANGDIVRQKTNKSPWGSMDARSALIIVEDTVRKSPFESRPVTPVAPSSSDDQQVAPAQSETPVASRPARPVEFVRVVSNNSSNNGSRASAPNTASEQSPLDAILAN